MRKSVKLSESWYLWITVMAVGCGDPAEAFLGEWQLWSINGVAVTEASPEIFEMPALSTDQAKIREGEVWSETRTIQRTLTVFSDGEYLDESVTQSTYVMSPRAVRAFGGMALGSDPVRETQPVDTSRTLGTWEVDGDTLRLRVDREQVVRRLLETLRPMNPGMSDEELMTKVDSSMAAVEIPEQFAVARVGERLVGHDHDGNMLTFRLKESSN